MKVGSYCRFHRFAGTVLNPQNIGPIGIFDSGYGGLTIMKEIIRELPAYDFIYLGDNARAPYGPRSFETVYEYTLECVRHLFGKGCNLVIVACNTASAKALRTIQQKDLQAAGAFKKVLGVIRPTTEIIGNYSETGHVGILGTTGTVSSRSYEIEIARFFPHITVHQEACPMWVPLIENNDFDNEGADFFIRRHINNLLALSSKIDTIILACTHYPIIIEKIRKFTPEHITILSQGGIVASSLKEYLARHPEIDARCAKKKKIDFFTTDLPETFNTSATLFFGQPVCAHHLDLHSTL